MQLVIAAIGRSRRADAAPWQDYLTRLPYGGQLLEAESKLPKGPARTKEESQETKGYEKFKVQNYQEIQI